MLKPSVIKNDVELVSYKVLLILILTGTLWSPGFVYAQPADSLDAYIKIQIEEVHERYGYSDPDSLSYYYAHLKETARDANRWHMVIQVLTAEAQSYSYFSRIDKMYKLIDEAEVLVDQHDEELSELDEGYQARSDLYFTKGVYHYTLGDYQVASKAFQATLQLHDKYQSLEPDYLYSVHSYLGACFLKILLIDKAIIHYNKGMAVLDDMDDAYKEYYLATNNMYLGDCKLALSKYREEPRQLTEGIAYYHKALAIIGEDKDNPSYRNTMLSAYRRIAEMHAESQAIDSAIYYIKLSLQYHKESDPKYITTYRAYGDIVSATKDYHRAYKLYNQALYYASRQKDVSKYDRSLPLFRQAKLYQEQAMYDSAYRHIEQGLSILSQKDDGYIDYRGILEGLELKLEVLARQVGEHNYESYLEEGLKEVRRGMEVINTVDRGITYSEYKQYFKAHVQGFLSAAVELVYIAIQKDYNKREQLELLYHLLESNKNSMLREAIQSTMAMDFAGVPEQVVSQEAYLKGRIGYLKKKIHDSPEHDQVMIWHDQLFGFTQSLDSLLRSIENKYPKYYDIKYSQSSHTTNELQSTLDHDELLIEYFWADDAIYMLGMTSDMVVANKAVDFENLADKLTSLIDFTRKNPQGSPEKLDLKSFSASSHMAYQQLVKPMIDQAGASIQSLIIVPDGMLAYIPFDILNTAKANEGDEYKDLNYLVRSMGVRHMFSSSQLLDVHKTGKSNYNYIGFAPSYSNATASARATGTSIPTDLKYNREEVDNASKYFQSTVFLGEEATERNFLDHAGQGNILHLATHAFASDEDPSYSGLIFASGSDNSGKDGLLYLYEIYNASLNADLVVLSGCETGTGKYYQGEGIISLGRAFRYAGCSNIVMSQWQVNDRATATIMDRFFHNLDLGEQKDDALREAKLQFLNDPKNKFLAHPYYWSAFVLSGDASPVSATTTLSTWIILGMILLIGMAIFFMIWRRRKSV